jgi:hypothetical protein
MKLLLPEILKKADELKDKREKIDWLRKNESVPLKGLLYLAYAPNVKWQLPEGAPPYKRDEKTPIGLSPSNFFLEARKMYLWVSENPSTLPKVKRESLFIEMLEAIHYTEADLIITVKEKQLQKVYKTLKEDLIREAFPGLLPPKEEKKKVPLA